jgi:hypothetical protein
MAGRNLFSSLCVAAALAALTACSASSTDSAVQPGTNAPPDLVKAAHERDEAVEKVDVATWDRLTTPDFTLVDDTGRFMNRADRLAEFKASKPADSPNPCQQEQFAVYGNVAMRRCLDKNAWWLESWVKSGDVWRLSAIQGTPTPSEGIEQEILMLEQTSNDATLKKDRAALEQLLADDYVSLNSNGTLTNKTEDITESMGANWTDAKMSNLKVRVYGNTAVVTGNLMLTGSAKGYVAGPRLRTDIWVRRNGRWQEVASHTSLVVKPQ